MERKMKIGDKEYSFKITNDTVLKIDEEYENCGTVFNGIVNAKKFYTNALILLACSCIEQEWEFGELTDTITGEQLYYSVPSIAMDLIFDYIGVNKKSKADNTEKNKVTS